MDYGLKWMHLKNFELGYTAVVGNFNFVDNGWIN